MATAWLYALQRRMLYCLGNANEVNDNVVTLASQVKSLATEIGFDLVGISAPEYGKHAGYYRQWLDHARHGEMNYMERNAVRRTHLREILPGVQAVICVGLNYYFSDDPASPCTDLTLAQISKYSLNQDYHRVMQEKLEAFVNGLLELSPEGQFRTYVDTGPVLEKALSERAGLGWIGKHTNLISKSIGSWFFIAEVLTDVALEFDAPHINRCGHCHRCIEACPTGAIVAPYQLDARLCISYLTIELKGAIPAELRSAIGNRIYGCDDCQDVCPWNRFATQTKELAFTPRETLRLPKLIVLMGLTEEEFHQTFRDSAIKRIKRRALLRNVAVALGNSRDPQAAPVLIRALDDVEPLIRGHVAWALGQIGGHEAVEALHRRAETEEDQWVLSEIHSALRTISA